MYILVIYKGKVNVFKDILKLNIITKNQNVLKITRKDIAPTHKQTTQYLS